MKTVRSAENGAVPNNDLCVEARPLRPTRFPIGFWATGLSFDTLTEAMVDDWKEAGFTLVHGPRFSYTPERAARMRRVLDWAWARDISVIVADSRTRALTEPRQSAAEYRCAAQAVHAEYGGHPSVFGYFVADEPEPADMTRTCECARIVREAAPEKEPFVNHLPWWPTLHERYGRPTFDSFMEEFIRMSAVRVLSYDCYGQAVPPDDPGHESGMRGFFGSLMQYGAAARRHGVDLWNIVLSTPHFSYAVSSEAFIRWQFNSTVAHGGRGLFYYTFYTPGTDGIHNFRNGPIDEFGERTEVFSWLKRTNRKFLETYGDLFLRLTLVQVTHAGRIYGSVPSFQPDDLVLGIEATGHLGIEARSQWKDHPFIVSRFADPGGVGDQFLMLVNHSLECSVSSRVAIRGADGAVWSYAWPGGERLAPEITEAAALWGGAEGVVRKRDHRVLNAWLAPGQEILYRLRDANRTEKT